MSNSASPQPTPRREDQENYWNRWNRDARGEETDAYTNRLRQVACDWVARLGGRPRILEVGCGVGWTSKALASLGTVMGVDLSPAAIESARQHCPEGTFIAGDFLDVPLSGPFDAVVTADTIAHVADQPRFVGRIAGLMVPDGLLVLMSQNSYAMNRSSWVPPPEPGQIRRWPTIRELRSMLARDFEVLRVTTAAPGPATSGIFRIVNARRVWGAMCAVLGTARATALYERLWLGNELVVIARRR